MSTNSSSGSESSLPAQLQCLYSDPTPVLLLILANAAVFFPLSISVFYYGFQKMKRSWSSALSHSDCFTYNMTFMQLISITGYLIMMCAVYGGDKILLVCGSVLSIFTWFGQMFFHVITCVDRFLAVVHAITYLKLKTKRAIRIRNVTVVFIWVIGLVGIYLLRYNYLILIIDLVLLSLSLAIVSFCSVSVLLILVRPGPGEQGGTNTKVAQSKQRAFFTISFILLALLTWITGNLFWLGMTISGSVNCIIMTVQIYTTIPSSLVQPMLFLHREGKLNCCKRNSQ